MTNDHLAQAQEFTETFGKKKWVDEPDAWGRRSNALLWLKLIKEEFDEAVDELLDVANGRGSMVSLAKELGDLLYVTYATAANFDIPMNEVLDEVHRSNMSKLDDDGKPVLRNDGKVLKGPNYEEADIFTVLYGVAD